MTMTTIDNGYWWVKHNALEPFIVRVRDRWVFMYGDNRWYRHEDFDFIKKVEDDAV